MGGTSLPPGFRFHPTDEELVGYYLKRKIEGLEFELEVIPVIDLYKFDPWELPDKSFLPKRDMEWFFFCPRDRKYPNGSRTNRVTVSGYWKATGKDRKVVCQSAVTGLRKTLVFYRGRAPLGDRTDWVMHEYRLSDDPSHQGTFSFQGGFALCRVVKKNDQGLKNKGDLQGEPRGKKVGETSVTGKITPTRLLNGLLSNTSSSNPVMSPCEIPTMKEFSSENLNKINPMNIWISPDLILDSSKDYQQAQVVADFFPHTDLQGSISPCHQSGSAGISPTSLYSNFIEEVEPIEDFGGISCLSSYTEPTKYMGLYGDEEMTYQSFEQTNLLSPYPLINGLEAWNPAPICRQSSGDGSLWDPSSLWLHEDNLAIVI